MIIKKKLNKIPVMSGTKQSCHKSGIFKYFSFFSKKKPKEVRAIELPNNSHNNNLHIDIENLASHRGAPTTAHIEWEPKTKISSSSSFSRFSYNSIEEDDNITLEEYTISVSGIQDLIHGEDLTTQKQNYTLKQVAQENAEDKFIYELLKSIKIAHRSSKKANTVSMYLYRIMEKLNKLEYDQKTNLPSSRNKTDEILQMVDEFEIIFKSFVDEFHVNKSKPTLFINIFEKACILNDYIFEKTAYLIKSKFNRELKYKMINIYQVLESKDLIHLLSHEIQIKIKSQYLRNLTYRFKRNEIKIKDYENISFEFSKIIAEFSKMENPLKSKEINLILKMILNINNDFLSPHNFAVDVSVFLNSENIKNLDLKIDIEKIIHADIIYLLQRFKINKFNQINIEESKIICIRINKLIKTFCQEGYIRNSKIVNSIIKVILQINTMYLFEIDIAIDVSPLMDLEIIQNFYLQNSIPDIVQSDIVHFYYSAIKEVEERIKIEMEKPIEKRKDIIIDANALADLSNEYATKFINNFLPINSKTKLTNEVFSNLIWITIYAYSFLYIFEEDKRNIKIKDIFKDYKFIIPTKIINEKSEDEYLTLKVTCNFITNLQELIHDKLQEYNYQLDPFKNFNTPQIRNLEELLNSYYTNFNSYPTIMQEWLKNYYESIEKV